MDWSPWRKFAGGPETLRAEQIDTGESERGGGKTQA